MRITSEVMVTRSLDRLQTRLKAYERSQSELAAGRNILRPSDDPSGTRRALSLKAAMASREQETRNASDAVGWLNAADAQLQSAMDRLNRARELAVRGANQNGQAERDALAGEIRQIAEEMQGIANARHMERPLFGGFTAGNAVEADATQPGGFRFAGSDLADPNAPVHDRVVRRVSDTELVRVNVTAGEWIGTGEDNLLALLHRLADNLNAGVPGAAANELNALTQAGTRIAASMADIGASTNRVDSARARADDLLLTLRTELSNVEDVDLARGIMELQVQQVAYEATLQALAKALPPSLVAFLR